MGIYVWIGQCFIHEKVISIMFKIEGVTSGPTNVQLVSYNLYKGEEMFRA